MKSRHILSMLLAVVLVIATLSLVSFSVSAAATEIASAEAFMAMTDGEYKLTQNIDLTEAGTLASFKGTLDGGGYTVTVSAPVFGELSGTVKNLTVAGEIAISGTTTVGALANTANGATVEGVTSTVTMTGSANGDYLRASGIIGTANATTVKGSTFSGSINVSALEHKENDNGIGGIAGHISQGSLITDCVNTGSIATSAKAKSNRGAQGGIVGFAQGSTITRCVNKGALSSDASSFCVGGILGRTQPTVQSDNSHIVHISYCANYGSVTKTNSGGELAGGIAAYYRQGSVKYSYNVGTISNSNGQCGGIFGYINAEKGGIEISYNYNIGSCKHGIGFAKNDNSVTSQDNYYLASAASDGTPFGSDGNFKGNFKATAVADAAALNAAVLALSETPFVVDPASNNGYAVFSWQCTHSGDKTPSCEGNKCAICGVLVDNNGTGEHSYPDEWTTIDEATVTADGSAERSCTGCGNTETKVLDALGKITPTDGVYAVSTEDQMLWLVAGINNGSVAANASIAIKEDITLTNGMDMITPTFKGTVDGEGHTVSGLTNTLFKRTGDGFTLKNLTMNGDIDYSALANDIQRTTASVTLYAEAGYTIENVVSNVNIKVSATDLNAGGIMGFANAGTVKNTTYAGKYTIGWTSGKGGAVGAIVGWLNDNGAKAYITDCAFTGEFTLTNSEKNDNALYIGGLIGRVRNNSAKETISGCVNTGTLTVNATGSKIYVGGIVGGFDSVSQNTLSYSVMNGTMQATGAICGSLIGYAGGAVPVTGCVALNDSGAYCGTGEPAYTDCYNASTVEKLGRVITYNGVKYQKYNFGYLNVQTSALAVNVIPADFVPAFSAGTINETADSTYTIGTEDLSAFVSTRLTATNALNNDVRFVLAANRELLDLYSSLSMTITFKKGDSVVKTMTKDVAKDLRVYASAVAAGNTYTAAEGTVLFGIIITDVPSNAWSDAVVTLCDNNGEAVAQGTVAASDIVIRQGVDMLTAGGVGTVGIETHHASTNYHPTFVFWISGNDAMFQDIRGEAPADWDNWSNPKYQWIINVNGTDVVIEKTTIYDGGTWGYLRADLGEESNYTYVNNKCDYALNLRIVEIETGKIAYYAFWADNGIVFTHKKVGLYEDETKPEGLTRVEGVTPVSGPKAGDGEGYEKLFDNDVTTKLCTGQSKDQRDEIVMKLSGETALKGIGLVNANDNEGSTGRTVTRFEVWISADGVNWGDSAAFTVSGEGVDKSKISDNYQERYFDFGTTLNASYVKLVVINDEMYQMSEVFLYQ